MLDVARELHEDNVRRARSLGNQQLEAVSLGSLAMVALDQGRYDDSLVFLNENPNLQRSR